MMLLLKIDYVVFKNYLKTVETYKETTNASVPGLRWLGIS